MKNMTTVILSVVAFVPFAFAGVVGYINQPKGGEVFSSSYIPKSYEPIVPVKENVFQLDEVYVYASLPKKVNHKASVISSAQKKIGCGEWRESLYGGKVRECEF